METMAITMIDPVNVAQTAFENRYLLSKLKKFVVVARTVGINALTPSYVHSVSTIDLTGELYKIVKNDYEEIRRQIINDGFDSLSGKFGNLIQPRTKGAEHDSRSRAFYA